MPATGRGGPFAVVMAHQLFELDDVEDAHVLLLYGDQPFLLEAREGAADGFQFEAEVAADFFTRHAQVELGGEWPRAVKRCDRLSRKAARRSSARIVPSSIMTPWSRTISRLITLWKWCCSVWISRERPSRCEKGMAQTSLSSRRDGVAGVGFGADAVETEQFAGHLEAGDLLPAVFQQHVGLEETAAYRVDCVEGFSGAVEVFAALDAVARRYDLVRLLDLRVRKAEGRQSSCRLQFEQAVLTTASVIGVAAFLLGIASPNHPKGWYLPGSGAL